MYFDGIKKILETKLKRKRAFLLQMLLDKIKEISQIRGTRYCALPLISQTFAISPLQTPTNVKKTLTT
jgi:hypothetical protein